MNVTSSNSSRAAVPFLIGDDGRVYINDALLKSSTVIDAKITARARPAYGQTLQAKER